jgi:transposase
MKFYVGIDMSKDFFNYCIKNKNKEIIKQGKLKNSKVGFDEIVGPIKKDYIDCIVGVESTSIYHIPFSVYLTQKDINLVVINPILTSKFAKFSSYRGKTDKKDASLIADFLIVNKIEASKYAISSEVKILARQKEKNANSISMLKDEIKKLIFLVFPELEKKINIFTSCALCMLERFPSAKSVRKGKLKFKNTFNRCSSNTGRDVSYSYIDIINLAKESVGVDNKAYEKLIISKIKQLKLLIDENDDIDKMIEEVIKENTVDEENINIVTSIKGIGNSLAVGFVSEIENIERFESPRKLIAFAGIDPIIKQSGKYRADFAISKKGSRHLRRTLYLMALNVVRYEGKFKDYYLSLKNKGKKPKQALIAVANKLAKTLWAMLTHKTPYVEGYS